MTILFRRIVSLLIALALVACASNPSSSRGAAYFPGGSQFYSYGTSQSKENFENIVRAQSAYALYSKEVYWQDIKPVRAPAHINMLQAYFPLSVRWQLKDGRQFIAQNIDVRAIMGEYFKNTDIKLPWQREGRARAKSGDYDPSFVHELKGDSLILKWLITTNHTPVNERFTSTGAATRWALSEDEYIVTTIKGTLTNGIDFDNWIVISK